MTATDERIADIALLERIVQRDVEGIALLYDRYSGAAFTLAYRLVCDRQMAEDIVHWVFLDAWRRAGSYDAQCGTVRVWLLTSVHHQTITALRTQRSRVSVAADFDASAIRAAVEGATATRADPARDRDTHHAPPRDRARTNAPDIGEGARHPRALGRDQQATGE